MRRLILALTLPVACLTMHAETTGRISGKVLNKEGKPIPGAKVTLKRIDIKWSTALTANKVGAYLQVGLEPKEYDLTVSAEGYLDYKDHIKIPLADVLVKDISLITLEEARSQALASGAAQAAPEDPGAALNASGRESFNLAIPFYNEGHYAEALPLVDKAYKNLTEAKEKLTDEQAKTDLAHVILKVEGVLGVCIAQAGTKKEEAEPYLLGALERNPKDQRVVQSLIETSKAKADPAAEQKYTAMLEALQGPNPDQIYNKGVAAFNNGQNNEAKAQLLRVLEIDPKYARAHYLLGMVDYALMDLKGTKQHFQKYLELAPTGDKAAEVKEMLKDPSLKNIK